MELTQICAMDLLDVQVLLFFGFYRLSLGLRFFLRVVLNVFLSIFSEAFILIIIWRRTVAIILIWGSIAAIRVSFLGFLSRVGPPLLVLAAMVRLLILLIFGHVLILFWNHDDLIILCKFEGHTISWVMAIHVRGDVCERLFSVSWLRKDLMLSIG
jgi:hypothetical protein